MDLKNHCTKNEVSIKHFLRFLIQETANLVTSTEEILNENLFFLCSEDQKLLISSIKT